MEEFKPKKIIVKYLANKASAIEEAELLNWVQSKKNQKVYKKFIKAQYLSDLAYNSSDHEAAFESFIKEISKIKKGRSYNPKKAAPYLKYAAILIGISITLLFLIKKEEDTTPFVVRNDNVSLQIINGDNEYFSIGTDKVVRTKKGIEVAVVNNGVLKYVSNTEKNKSVYNILNVPFGKTFKVILSDGSTVELNSGSTLKYPSVFKENEPRIVDLEGEAFFSVSKTISSPFIVNSNTSSIKVLGTEFNVSSYLDDEATEVVLVHGSVGVKINSPANNDQQDYSILSPSQMASISKNSKNIKISNVNIDKYIAWRNGDLFFENDKFESIKKILERHYNVKIINHFTELNKFRYNGNFKNDSIEKILNTIKTHTNFSFERKGDTISINNPKKSKRNK